MIILQKYFLLFKIKGLIFESNKKTRCTSHTNGGQQDFSVKSLAREIPANETGFG